MAFWIESYQIMVKKVLLTIYNHNVCYIYFSWLFEISHLGKEAMIFGHNAPSVGKLWPYAKWKIFAHSLMKGVFILVSTLTG